MGATRFEYRFRYALHALVFLLGFSFYLLPSARESTWLVLTPLLERTGWFSFSTATVSLLVLAIIFASTGAFLRTWGTAFLGAGVVQSGSMHGDAIHADGPFRGAFEDGYRQLLKGSFGVIQDFHCGFRVRSWRIFTNEAEKPIQPRAGAKRALRKGRESPRSRIKPGTKTGGQAAVRNRPGMNFSNTPGPN